MSSLPTVSIEEVYQYYRDNNIEDFPKTKIGYPNMTYKSNRDIKNMLLQIKIKKEEDKVKRQRENVKSFCSSYVSGKKTECMICCEEINNTAILECGHIFCLSCMVKHGRENNNCPCCRFEFTTKPKKFEKMTTQTLAGLLHQHINSVLPNRGINYSQEQLPARGNQMDRSPMSIQNFITNCITEAQYIQANNPTYTEESLQMRRDLETRIMNEIVHISLDVGNDIINWYGD